MRYWKPLAIASWLLVCCMIGLAAAKQDVYMQPTFNQDEPTLLVRGKVVAETYDNIAAYFSVGNKRFLLSVPTDSPAALILQAFKDWDVTIMIQPVPKPLKRDKQ